MAASSPSITSSLPPPYHTPFPPPPPPPPPIRPPLPRPALAPLAVDPCREVQRHEVAGLRRPVDAGQAREPFAQGVELLLDLGVGDSDVVDADLDALQLGQGDLRANVDL